MKSLLLAAVFGLIATSAGFAWSDMERMTAAQSLGDLLSSEKFCNLTYDQGAIASYINRIVPADDMEFNNSLRGSVALAEYQLPSMSPSMKTAHCTQVSRIAKSYKFVQ